MNIENPKTGRGRLLRYGPFVLCVLIIFGLSTNEASMTNTSRFVRPLLEFLFPNAPEPNLVFYHAIIRKLAHLAEYSALGLLAARAFRSSTRVFLYKHWIAVSMTVVLVVALVDEFFQSLNPSRTGSIYDVALDFAGGAIGVTVLIVMLIAFGRDLIRKQRINMNE